MMSPPRNPALSGAQLYGILDLGYVAEIDALAIAGKMLSGGVQLLQLRAKNRKSGEILSLARELAKLCSEHQVPLVLNDYPELVPESGAQGAHLGQGDMSVDDARNLAGEHAIIGKSTHSIAQALAAQQEGPDYIGFGPLFATPTKPTYIPIGLDDIRAVQNLVPVPVFCIGGIKRENLPEIIASGARRVVIVSGILQAENPRAYCQECRRILASTSVLQP